MNKHLLKAARTQQKLWEVASGDGVPPVVTPPGYATVTYTEDTTTDFPNPERGWYSETKRWGGAFGTAPISAPVSQVVGYTKPTLELYFINLRSYISSSIPQGFLDTMDANYREARAAGIKLVVRHAYIDGDNETPLDATLSQMKAHIDQLAPYWVTYQDVIACMQGGFAGPWGEQWVGNLNNSNIQTTADRQELIQYLMANTPSTMMVQWRDPGVWTMYEYATGATYANRFDGTAVQRAGHYNDSFMMGEEMVTYWDGNWTTEQQYAYIDGISPYVAMGGETSDQGGGLTSWNDCAYTLTRMAAMGWDYLNSEFWEPVLTKWYDNGNGCLAEISRRLGYRIAITNATLPTSLSANQAFDVVLTLKNSGFGKVFNKRPIDLFFVNGAEVHSVRLTEDARTKLPLGGATLESSWTAVAPSGLVSGRTYDLHLRLADPTLALSSNPAYSLRLANVGLWNATTGRHNLNSQVVVGTATPPVTTTLLGVGSSTSSLVSYPKTGPVYAGDWWVDPARGTNGSGSAASPFNNLSSALAVVSDGERIIVTGGTLSITSRFFRNTNWTTGIQVVNYADERVLIDGSAMPEGSNAQGLYLDGSNETWKGFHFKNCNGENGSIIITGTYNKLEDVWVSHNSCWYFDSYDRSGGGIWIYAGATNDYSRGSYNTIQDCATWRNGDTSGSGTNVADNMVVTAAGGSYYGGFNSFVRCFAANGPDDNYDAYRGRYTLWHDSVSYKGGYWYTGAATSGDGNGFKLGGGAAFNGSALGNVARGCISAFNRTAGFDDNSTDLNNSVLNATSVSNGGVGIQAGSSENTIVRNSIALSNGTNYQEWATPGPADTFNTWNLSITDASFADTATHDYSLDTGSACIGAGSAGGNLGASDVALEIYKEWVAKDLVT